MALTELQLPTKADFYSNLQNSANQLNRLIKTIADLSEFIGFVLPEDLNSMGVPTGDIRIHLADYRTALEEFISYTNGNPITPTVTLTEIIDNIRSM